MAAHFNDPAGDLEEMVQRLQQEYLSSTPSTDMQDVDLLTQPQIAVTDPDALKAKLQEILPTMSALGITELHRCLVDLRYTVEQLERLGLNDQQTYVELRNRIIEGPPTTGIQRTQFFRQITELLAQAETLVTDENNRRLVTRPISFIRGWCNEFVESVLLGVKVLIGYITTRASRLYDIARRVIHFLSGGIFGSRSPSWMGAMGYDHID